MCPGLPVLPCRAQATISLDGPSDQLEPGSSVQPDAKLPAVTEAEAAAAPAGRCWLSAKRSLPSADRHAASDICACPPLAMSSHPLSAACLAFHLLCQIQISITTC